MGFAQSLEIILAQLAQRDSSGPLGFNAGNAPISVTSYRRFMQEMFRKSMETAVVRLISRKCKRRSRLLEWTSMLRLCASLFMRSMFT